MVSTLINYLKMLSDIIVIFENCERNITIIPHTQVVSEVSHEWCIFVIFLSQFSNIYNIWQFAIIEKLEYLLIYCQGEDIFSIYPSGWCKYFLIFSHEKNCNIQKFLRFFSKFHKFIEKSQNILNITIFLTWQY